MDRQLLSQKELKEIEMRIDPETDICPVCHELWDDCVCEQSYPMQSLIDRDDEFWREWLI